MGVREGVLYPNARCIRYYYEYLSNNSEGQKDMCRYIMNYELRWTSRNIFIRLYYPQTPISRGSVSLSEPSVRKLLNFQSVLAASPHPLLERKDIPILDGWLVPAAIRSLGGGLTPWVAARGKQAADRFLESFAFFQLYIRS